MNYEYNDRSQFIQVTTDYGHKCLVNKNEIVYIYECTFTPHHNRFLPSPRTDDSLEDLDEDIKGTSLIFKNKATLLVKDPFEVMVKKITQ